MSEQEKRWPVGGYAPGYYAGCKCTTCGQHFIGAKRAYTCADCTILVLLDSIDYLDAEVDRMWDALQDMTEKRNE